MRCLNIHKPTFHMFQGETSHAVENNLLFFCRLWVAFHASNDLIVWVIHASSFFPIGHLSQSQLYCATLVNSRLPFRFFTFGPSKNSLEHFIPNGLYFSCETDSIYINMFYIDCK